MAACAPGEIGCASFNRCSIAAFVTIAHPGGLDASGCHNNRKTGDYHCHRAGSGPKRESSAASRSGLMGRRAEYYPNCSAALAAGAAPIHAGDPGYRAGLDRDGDGVACE